MKRVNSLIVNGSPKYVRIYSNEGTKNETLDCITVVFSKKRTNGEFVYVSASKTGSGVYLHGFSDFPIDKPKYGHLGKKVEFSQLDKNLQFNIMRDYCDLWEIPFEL